MALKYPLEIASVYDFAMKAPAILGAAYKSATVLALLDFDSANQIENVTPVHAQVYSQLGSGVPRNARDLIYVKIRTSTGELRVVAMDWLDGAPTLVSSSTVQVVITDVNLSQIDTIREVLVYNGFPNVTITVMD